MKGLQQTWYGISPRERLMVALGALGMVAILGYALVWQPWQEALTRLRGQVPAKQETLAWMQAQSQTLQPLLARAKQRSPADAAPLLTVVERSAKQANVHDTIRRMSPGEENQVKVWLTDADFDKWLQWLETLRRQRVEVVSANINRSAPNKVTIRVTLQR